MKTNTGFLPRIKKAFADLPEKLTKLPLKARRSILLGTAVLLILVTALVIVSISSCSGKEAAAETQSRNRTRIQVVEKDDGSAQLVVVDPVGSVTVLEDDYNPQAELTTPEPTLCPDEPLTVTPEATVVYESLKKHDKSDSVTTLQTRLMELGYLDIDEPTNYFGSSTEYGVRLFQRQHSLQEDGVAGQETLALLYSSEAEKYCIKEGAEGKDVKMLQEQLVDLGYLKESEVDYVYGATTITAIKAFQERNNLHADGLAGEKTLAMLYSDDAKISYALYKAQKAAEASAAAAAKKAKATATPKTSTKLDKFLSAAKSKLGCEYVLGDRGPNTFDCSGFVYWCLRQAGVSVTRLNAAGYSEKSSWTKISSVSSLQKGDILFFKSDDSDRVSHCGIYIGSGMMIDASSSQGQVVKRSLSNYWKRNFVCARRPWG